METLTEAFRKEGILIKTIKEPERFSNYYLFYGNKKELINIYVATIPLKQNILTIANQPKIFFLNTIGYQPASQQFDYYETDNFLDNSLDKIAHWIRSITMVISLLSVFYLFYLVVSGENNE